MNASTEERLEIFTELKKAFEVSLQSRHAETEKCLLYMKDIYSAHFENQQKKLPETLQNL